MQRQAVTMCSGDRRSTPAVIKLGKLSWNDAFFEVAMSLIFVVMSEEITIIAKFDIGGGIMKEMKNVGKKADQAH